MTTRIRRRGTFIPIVALCLVGLFAFTALAIDLGILMVMRTDCQNAADSSALVGTRMLDNKPTSTNNNAVEAMKAAGRSVDNNILLNVNFQNSNIVSIQTGTYDYDTSVTPNVFKITNYSTSWTPAGGSQPAPGAAPSGKSWTAMVVEVTGTQPTFFNKVMGVNSMTTGARAVAVHRPRDVAVVIDITGSMRFGSSCSANGVYLSADPLYPQMSHYQRYTNTTNYVTNNPNASTSGSTGRPNPFFTTAGWVDPSSGEFWAPNNYTVVTAGGPACVKDFLYDGGNLSTPATTMVTPAPNMSLTPPMPRAFHHWDPPVSNVGDPDNYVAPTYDFSGWWTTKDYANMVMFPAPDSFKNQSDVSGTQKYDGDRYGRKKGQERTVATTLTWDPTQPNGAAITVAEYLYWVDPYASGTTLPTTMRSGSSSTAPSGRTFLNLRDAAWERYGYDLDVADYVSNRNTGGVNWDPRWDWKGPAAGPDGTTGQTGASWVHLLGSGTNPTTTWRPKMRTDTSFKGYSMGPGYWGKTFYIWPPDPRWGGGTGSVLPASINSSNPVKDTNSNWICDWRRRFFLKGDSTAWTAQTNGATEDNLSSTTGAGNIEHIDELMFTNGTGNMLRAPSTTTFQVNYAAILKWIKSPPMTLPPNLRAGRVVYYTSIPDDVNYNSSSPGAADYDKLFWKLYIDYVLRTGNINSTEGFGWPEGVTPSINQNDLTTYTTAGTSTADPRPYMPYTDNPSRPRSQMWFGPITMMAFLANKTSNMWAGTIHESQAWQLKAGMNSALDDIRNNAPNTSVGMCYFTQSEYGSIAVSCSQDWTSLKAALFYPLSLLNANNIGDPTKEVRPYDINFTYQGGGDVPNAQSGTDPVSGLAMGFNILSPSSSVTLPPRPSTWPSPNPRTGRRGASKVIIFETDGVPNAHSNTSYTAGGYNSYYTTPTSWTSDGNGNSNAINPAIAVVDKMVLQMSTTTSGNSGLSTSTSPARVYSIGFGDLFSTASATFQPTARQFLLDIQKHGNTSASGDTIGTAGASPPYSDGQFPQYQIVTGPYQTRIDKLKTAFERIMQSGVQVTLIE